MAIETAGKTEQTKLVEESREERLNRLFYLEMTIQDKTASRQKLVDSANALKNEIKTYQKDKIDLLNLINSGQGTFITVAVNDSQEEDTDDSMPSDEELSEFDDPQPLDAVESTDTETQEDETAEGEDIGSAEPASNDVADSVETADDAEDAAHAEEAGITDSEVGFHDAGSLD